MKNLSLVKIVIVGPESSGKTFLAEKLALHYKCPWVPEYAREYLQNLKSSYSKEDVEKIAKRQIKSEDALAAKSVGHPERSRRVARFPTRDDSTTLTMTTRGADNPKPSQSLLICDTNLLVIKIWMEHKYGSVPKWIDKEISQRQYHLHLLTAPDIPYENDPLRENPEMGKYFFRKYEQLLQSLNIYYHIISGKDRVAKAKNAVSKVFKLKER